MEKKYRLVFVCPRYLTSKAGGAEVLSRTLAEKTAEKGHEVEFWATTALDHATWENALPEQTFKKNGLTIRLFRVNDRGNLSRYHEIDRKISEGTRLTPEEEKIWVDQSVNSDSLNQAVLNEQKRFDYFIFIPYLFGLTIKGIELCPEKSILIPCLHEENFAYLDCIKRIFVKAKKILFNAPPEMDLAQKLYGIPSEKCFLVSMGFDFDKKPDPEGFKQKYEISLPYITYAGRREEGKNFHLLLEMVRLFQRIYPNKLQFITMGTPKVDLLSSDKGKILDLGFVTEEDKINCFAGALLNCQPSLNESFSIIIMESWICKVPVMVHRNCKVTSHWVERAKAGYRFSDYFEFEQNIIHALEHPGVKNEMGLNGQYFVENNFKWGQILDKFLKAMKE